MIIKRLTVQQCGPIRGPLRLELARGVNLLAGPNESGKTTVMTAIWHALTSRASSNRKEIQALRPHGGGRPEVHLSLEGPRGTWELVKVFSGASGRASLTVTPRQGGAPATYEDDEADRALRELLGMGQADPRKGAPDHLGVWPLIWVKQGDAPLEPTAALEDPARRTLELALASLGGDLLAGDAAESVFQPALDEHLRYYTQTGQEARRDGAPLYEARRRAAAAREALDDLKAASARAAQELEEHQRLLDTLAAEQARLPDLQAALERSREARRVQQDAEQRRQAAQASMDRARVELERAEERLAARRRYQERLPAAQAEARANQQRLEDLGGQLDAARMALPDASVRLAEAVNAEHNLDRQRRRLEAFRGLWNEQRLLESLDARLKATAAHDQEQQLLQAQLDAIALRPEQLKRLESLNKIAVDAELELRVASAVLKVKAHQALTLTMGDDVFELGAGASFQRHVASTAALAVPGVLELEIVPGGRNLDEVQRHAAAHRLAFREALAELGLPDLEAARRVVEERARLAAELQRLASTLRSIAPEGAPRLRQEVAAAQRAVLARQHDLDALTAADDPVPADAEHLDALLRTLSGDAGRARSARDAAQRQHQRAQDAVQRVENAIVQARDALDLARRQLQRAQEELDGHVARSGDNDALIDQRERAEQATRAARAALEALAERDTDAADAARACADDERALQTQQRRVADLKARADELRGRLQADSLQNLPARLEDAEQRAQHADDHLARVLQRARAARLLYDTLVQCRREARQAFLEPLRREVRPLIQRLFDEADLDFTERFEVSELRRPGQAPDAFESLSFGAREQIGVIVRLALARLISPEGDPMPILLDDAFVGTDPERLRRMARVLAHVAEQHQVLLITCHAEAWLAAGLEPAVTLAAGRDSTAGRSSTTLGG